MSQFVAYLGSYGSFSVSVVQKVRENSSGHYEIDVCQSDFSPNPPGAYVERPYLQDTARAKPFRFNRTASSSYLYHITQLYFFFLQAKYSLSVQSLYLLAPVASPPFNKYGLESGHLWLKDLNNFNDYVSGKRKWFNFV